MISENKLIEYYKNALKDMYNAQKKFKKYEKDINNKKKLLCFYRYNLQNYLNNKNKNLNIT